MRTTHVFENIHVHVHVLKLFILMIILFYPCSLLCTVLYIQIEILFLRWLHFIANKWYFEYTDEYIILGGNIYMSLSRIFALFMYFILFLIIFWNILDYFHVGIYVNILREIIYRFT